MKKRPFNTERDIEGIGIESQISMSHDEMEISGQMDEANKIDMPRASRSDIMVNVEKYPDPKNRDRKLFKYKYRDRKTGIDCQAKGFKSISEIMMHVHASIENRTFQVKIIS